MSGRTPDDAEHRTQEWLRDRFLEGRSRRAEPDQRVYDDTTGQPCRMTRQQFQVLQRKLKIFRWLDRLDIARFLDVGSGYEHYPDLVHARYGAEAYYSDLTHQMNLPHDDHPPGKRDHAVTMNIARLPFPDQAFDAALSSEVLEHLVRPVEAIAELLRITRKALVMTSLEALALGRRQQRWAYHRVDVRQPHVERNFFLLDEFRALFGPDLHCENLFYVPHLPANPFTPVAVQDSAYAAYRDRETLADALCRAVSFDGLGPGAMGILLVKLQPGCVPRPRTPADDRALARWLIEQDAALERRWLEAVARRPVADVPQRPPADRPVAPGLLDVVRCPDCRGRLQAASAALRCGGCGATYASECGVPILYAQREGEPIERCLDRLCGGDPGRRRLLRRLARRVRHNERAPGRLRRQLWRLEDRFDLGTFFA